MRKEIVIDTAKVEEATAKAVAATKEASDKAAKLIGGWFKAAKKSIHEATRDE